MLSEQSRSILLKIARERIYSHITAAAETTYDELLQGEIPEELNTRNGVFVTLHRLLPGGAPPELRGCIGNVIGFQPLFASVRRLAIESATGDPRFPPLKDPAEFSALTIEISVLSIPREIPSFRHIRIGTDGIILDYSSRSALFLPQVAVEQGWGLEETLDHLAMKAGLMPGSWKEPACTFKVFQAEVFSEADVSAGE